MSSQQSLMSKIVGKDIFTPYEAILIQYLNTKYKGQQMPDILNNTNLYTSTENIKNLYSPQDLKQLLSFNTLQDAQEYDAYKWAADLLVRYEEGSEETTYKAIALFNELRYFRDESYIRILVNKDQTIPELVEKFTAFSKVHKKYMSFKEIMESLVFTIKMLIITVDNVLVLNHFLNGMIEINDLQCANNLKKVFSNISNNSVSEKEPFDNLNISPDNYQQMINIIINENHPKFIEYARYNLALFNWKLSVNFEKESMDYVKKNIQE